MVDASYLQLDLSYLSTSFGGQAFGVQFTGSVGASWVHGHMSMQNLGARKGRKSV